MSKIKVFPLVKIISIVLLFSFLLLACTNAAVTTEEEPVVPAEEVQPEKEEVSKEKYRIAFIPQLVGIPYFTAMDNGGKRAAEAFGVEWIYTGGTTTDAAEQVRILDSLVQQGVDAVSVATLDSESLNPALKRALEAGVKAYTSDSDSPSGDRLVFVCQALGKDLGYAFMDTIAEDIGGKGQVAIVSNDPTSTNLNTWIEFMKERKEAYPDIEIVDVRYAIGGSSEKAMNESLDLMTRYPDLKGLVSMPCSGTPGLAQAVIQADKVGEVYVTGCGTPASVKSFIEAGVMKHSVIWDPEELGYLTVWAGIQLIEGKPFLPENDVPGIDRKIQYFEEDKTLLLGPPLIIDINNVNDYDF